MVMQVVKRKSHLVGHEEGQWKREPGKTMRARDREDGGYEGEEGEKKNGLLDE